MFGLRIVCPDVILWPGAFVAVCGFAAGSPGSVAPVVPATVGFTAGRQSAAPDARQSAVHVLIIKSSGMDPLAIES